MKTKIVVLATLIMFSFSSCTDILDRPQLTSWDDENFWTSEANLRMYANGFYERYFVGYNIDYGTAYAAHTGYTFSDDIVVDGTQTNFDLAVPNSEGSNTNTNNTTTGAVNIPWKEKYSGPSWNFAWARKANIMIDRIDTKMGGVLNTEAKDHWMGIGRFFRGIDYVGLVSVFGDVPYYDHEVSSANLDDLYKPRTPRNEVMDAVYDDFVFALNNVRTNDGALFVNKYVVAGYVSRWALFEGTWQKYHKNDNARATKFLNLAVNAANVVISSGNYDIVTEFRALFGSDNLATNKDVIFYRHYDMGQGIKHSVPHSCNMSEGRTLNPNLALIKAFICSDGTDWQTSANPANQNFELSNLIETRDPRFEASFWKNPTYNSRSSCLYTAKFISRDGLRYLDTSTPILPEYSGTNSTSDYPVMRYAEVLLNWIEAKAELATLGGTAVSQPDIDASINKIRNRPLHADAIAKNVSKTVPMLLTALPSSPDRGDVPQLLWEIRRERRMEFFGEHSRIVDLRRWKKLDYMDDTQNPDILRGTWINANTVSGLITPTMVGILAVTDMAGTVTEYNGSNAPAMIGFYTPTRVRARQPFLNVFGINPYLAPVGRTQRIDYQTRGYELAQTEGWPTEL